MKRWQQDTLVYSGLLAIIGLCLWAQHRMWRKGEDRLVAIERRLDALETNWAVSDALLRRAEEVVGRIERGLKQPLTVYTTNVTFQQSTQGVRHVSWPTNAPSGAQRSGPPTPRP